MPMAFTEKGPIFFAHVPKTGGTSVEDYLIRRFGPLALSDVNKRAKTPGTGLLCAVNHLSALDLREMVPAQSIMTFAVVRDPLNRILSEYSWQRGASRMSRLSFSTWLRIMVRLLNLDARTYGNHIRPQDEMVPEDAEIFRLEDGFDDMIARLDAVTGTEYPDKSVGHFKGRSETRKDILVTREDVTLVQKVYARDYARFGYTPRDLSQFPADPRAGARTALAAVLAPAVIWKQRRDWLR